MCLINITCDFSRLDISGVSRSVKTITIDQSTHTCSKCDTSSNDTSSNEPFRLKVTSSKWLFVECTHCRKMISSNSFDENISWLIANKLVAMLLCWSCAHHMTADNEYGQCRRWPNLNMVRIFYSAVPVGSFVNKTSEKNDFIQNKIFIHGKSYRYQFISISCFIWIMSLSIWVSFEAYNPGYRMYFQYRHNRHNEGLRIYLT